MTSLEQITDPEVRLLASLAAVLETEYAPGTNDPWLNSPFGWIQARPSRQKGAIGEALVAGWAAAKGFDVTRTGDAEADRVINSHRVEIKYSSLWTDNGIYKFQQIRNQKYEYCLCLGVSPFDAHAWFIPKSELLGTLRQGLSHQHGGAQGRDTRWLSFPASSPPAWLRPFGGRLADVARLIANTGSVAKTGTPMS